MDEITEIDRKLLYQLIKNSRQSYKSIGKAIKQSKNVVSYRIGRLEKLGIIRKYYTIIDIFKIGYLGIRFYTKLQYITPTIHRQIINHFISDKHVGAVYSLQGAYDLDVIYWIKQYQDFYISWQKTLRSFCNYFHHQKISFLHQVMYYNPLYLLEKTNTALEREAIELNAFEKTMEVDDIEYNILRAIATNARISTTQIAHDLGFTEEIVRYRIKKMKKLGIIKGFSVDIDISKIGYEWIAVQIYLKDYTQRDTILAYVKQNPFFVAQDVSIGLAHLELEFHISTINQLYQIMDDIMQHFPDAIRMYSYFKPFHVHKLQLFPEVC